MQVFARKVSSRRAKNIDKEPETNLQICKAMDSTVHHIVTVLYIRKLLGLPHEIFIDIKLCDLSLEDYLYSGSFRTPKDHTIAHFIKDALPPYKSRQIGYIMKQITNGIQCLYSFHLVHRNLKPRNGTVPPRLENIRVIVLYSRKDMVWKFSDFGFTIQLDSAYGR